MSPSLIHYYMDHFSLLPLHVYNLRLQQVLAICHPFTCLIPVDVYSGFRIVNPSSMLIIFIDYSKILMYSSFCFWSCRLYSFPELFRSLPFPLTHFSEIVSYACNTVRVIWSDGFLEERNGKMKTQPSGNWVRKSLWTIFLYIPNVWWLHAVGWPDFLSSFLPLLAFLSTHLLWTECLYPPKMQMLQS